MNLEIKKMSAEAVRRSTDRAQGEAADPQASAWVNANAGTGKTHVLTLRVLRLLLAGTSPERILCLTYTKAAAAEMSKRVFDRLAKWVTADDATLAKELASVTGTEVADKTKAFARTLFARAIETPGGLKVQTIHAFAERLLQRFPLEAGVPPDFKILDDDAARDLKSDAIEATLTEATGAPKSPLGKALDVVIRYAADARFDELISKAVEERKWLEVAARVQPRRFRDELEAMDAYLRRQLNVRTGLSLEALHTECAGVFTPADLAELCTLLSGGGKTDLKYAEALTSVRSQRDPRDCAELLADYFLVSRDTSKEKPRDSLMSKALSVARPDLLALGERARDRFAALQSELKALTLVEASMALYQIAGHVLRHYQAARSSAGALDFDDLILKTTALLSGDSGEAQWVLYKLDGGLDHILVDEAQDTSPEQWEIIRAWRASFSLAPPAATASARSLPSATRSSRSIRFRALRPRCSPPPAGTSRRSPSKPGCLGGACR